MKCQEGHNWLYRFTPHIAVGANCSRVPVITSHSIIVSSLHGRHAKPCSACPVYGKNTQL